MNSIWTESVEMPHFESLEGNVKTDVLIIGGGITGLLCAYFLHQQGVDYLLAEGRTICSGVTKNTTAKITAQHGLIYADLLKKVGLNIYEHTFVTKLSENTALTEKARITFQRIIFATHFPIDNKHGLYFLKMYQHRSYVIALMNAAPVKEMYVDEDKKGMSFRNYGELLLVGGGSHRTGKCGGDWQELREYAQKHYPQAEERYYWAAQDCMPLDNVPYIGLYSKTMSQCYVATGYHKWGMTSAMAAAMILTDQIMGKENPYKEVFCPSRSMWKPQLFVNGTEAMVNLLTPTTKRCPHLGCALKWNAAERSWDCPCHGSRFDEDGGLIDNPANGDWDQICTKITKCILNLHRKVVK